MRCQMGTPIATAADRPLAEVNRAPGDSQTDLPPLSRSISPAIL